MLYYCCVLHEKTSSKPFVTTLVCFFPFFSPTNTSVSLNFHNHQLSFYGILLEEENTMSIKMLSLRTYVKKSFTSSLCILLANLDIFSLHNNFILLLKVKHRDLSSFFSAAHITAAPHASTRSNNSQNISKLTTAPHKSYLLKLLAAFSFVRSDEKVSLQAYTVLRNNVVVHL